MSETTAYNPWTDTRWSFPPVTSHCWYRPKYWASRLWYGCRYKQLRIYVESKSPADIVVLIWGTFLFLLLCLIPFAPEQSAPLNEILGMDLNVTLLYTKGVI